MVKWCAVWVALIASGPAWAQSTTAHGALERVIVGIAAKAAPSVVRIEVSRRRDHSPPGRGGVNLMEMFRNTHPAYFKRPEGPAIGFVAGEGLVLTSWYNVAGDVDGVRVTSAAGRTAMANILGTDRARDIALLSVDKDFGAPVLALDPAAVPRIGSFAIVADGGASFGIVSALDRERGTALQIDARINYGNSGAPVLDLRGRVIGMAGHVSHWSGNGQSSGVGYATHSRYIASVLDALAAGQSVQGPRQAMMGVNGEDSPDGGVVLNLVSRGSAADSAGIKVGDRVVRFGGDDVGSMLHLFQLVARRAPGETVEVEVVRRGDRIALQCVLGERPEGE